jgi:DNA-binding beta-propeller fold protein YncE
VVGARMLVSDYATGDIVVYNIAVTPANEMFRIKTPPGIMGIKIGPDGFIYYVNHTNSEVVRIESFPAGTEEQDIPGEVGIYPNPATDRLNVDFQAQVSGEAQLSVLDLSGRLLLTSSEPVVSGLNHLQLSLTGVNLTPGMYIVKIEVGNSARHTKLYVQ